MAEYEEHIHAGENGSLHEGAATDCARCNLAMREKMAEAGREIVRSKRISDYLAKKGAW